MDPPQGATTLVSHLMAGWLARVSIRRSPASSPLRVALSEFRADHRQHGSFAGTDRNVRIADQPDTTRKNGLDERIGLMSSSDIGPFNDMTLQAVRQGIDRAAPIIESSSLSSYHRSRTAK
jgi:hypothetical protein